MYSQKVKLGKIEIKYIYLRIAEKTLTLSKDRRNNEDFVKRLQKKREFYQRF